MSNYQLLAEKISLFLLIGSSFYSVYYAKRNSYVSTGVR
jgi:hypothetical protein